MLERCNPELQVSLDSEAVVDTMDAEQTWPTEDELKMAEGISAVGLSTVTFCKNQNMVCSIILIKERVYTFPLNFHIRVYLLSISHLFNQPVVSI